MTGTRSTLQSPHDYIGRIRAEPELPTIEPSKDQGAGCWALADARGAFWDGRKHASGLPMTTIIEERAYRFPSAELASVANLAGFEPVRIFLE